MNSQLISFLNLLDFESDNILFEQREQDQARTPFEMEKQLLAFVTEGKPDEMVTFYEEMLADQPGIRISVGKMSRDRLRHLKYMAVSAIALLCRAAMYGGLAEAEAYSRSDKAIQKIDKMNNADRILLFLIAEVYGYAEMVEKSRVNASYSKAVRNSIEYIVANLHSNITLEDLAQFAPHNKEYFAKVFKKEVGKSFSEYVLEQRVAEAKIMLKEGKSSQEIAYTLQFCSQSYFIKQFKKVAEMTPQEYRARHGTSADGA